MESWLDKQGLAKHLSCSVRSIEFAVQAGMPHSRIFGRIKFQVSTVLPWLEDHGYVEHRGTLTAPNHEEAA